MAVRTGLDARWWALVGLCSVLACGGRGHTLGGRDGAADTSDGGSGDLAGERGSDARVGSDGAAPDALRDEAISDGALRDGEPRDIAPDIAAPDASPEDGARPDAADAPGDGRPPICTVPNPNLQIDPMNCGVCGHSCDQINAVTSCVQGQCTFDRCYVNTSGHCAGNAGCETTLGTDTDCAACGDRSCAVANTLLTCHSAGACATAVCAAGFGNCDRASPDCEASFAAGASCLPSYLGTSAFATQTLDWAATAIGTDGSFFVAGAFKGTVDFDPTAGEDVRSTSLPSDTDGFITKLDADGRYAWTRTFVGQGAMSLRGLAAASGGAIVAVGSYSGSVDLDPGASTAPHTTTSLQEALVVKLAADGSLIWGRTFPGWGTSPGAEPAAVAADAADAVYVAGSYTDNVDFDPGPALAVRAGSTVPTAVLVRLTAAGDFSWAQTVPNGSCAARLSSVAVATDGAVWGAGWAIAGSNCALPSQSIPSGGSMALIVSYGSASGLPRGAWTLQGPFVDETMSVAAGPSGSVYVGGSASGTVDLDPGPGEAPRWLGGYRGGFIVSLGSDARFNWAAALPDAWIDAVTSTADGGVLGAGRSRTSAGFVTKLNGDGTSAWSFTSGQLLTEPTSVAARGGRFTIAGVNRGSNDFDPGAATDWVSSDGLYLSRFAF